MIRVLFFAQLREQLQCESLEINCISPTNVASVRTYLIDQHASWTQFLSSENVLSAVNQTMVKEYHPVLDGDEVAFFPPVTGG